ncbi:MAG: LCP family protein [Lachnospiraceae bacterium]|nr:LCP family protein [Lachnospiraceae bacterium]
MATDSGNRRRPAPNGRSGSTRRTAPDGRYPTNRRSSSQRATTQRSSGGYTGGPYRDSRGGYSQPTRRKKSRKKKRHFLFILEILVILVLVVALYVVYRLDLADTGNKSSMEEVTVNEEVLAQIEDEENDEWKMDGYTNIALFGVDSRDMNLGKGTLADTIIVASLNNETGEIKLCSIFRDTYCAIGEDSDGKQTFTKANTAYSAGGPGQAVQMLNTNLDMDISEYVTVGFKALVDTIDSLGGIEIEITEDEIHFLNDYQIGTAEAIGIPQSQIINVTSPGRQTLNGLQATSYCRIRYTKGDDFKRAERQRTVLSQVAEKAMTADVATLNSLIDAIFPLCNTSLTKTEILSYATRMGKFRLGDQSGFPFERVTGVMGRAGSCVVAEDFAQNVVEFHRFLFGDSEYTPSQTVKDVSQRIQSDRQKNGV